MNESADNESAANESAANELGAESVVLHQQRAGAGQPVIFSHGVGSDSTVWEGMAGVLAAAHETLLWDQAGHGKSPHAAAESYGPVLAFDSLVSVAAPFEKVILVGHSLGGYLSLRYAIMHPERVAALVLVATGPGFRAQEAMDKWNADVRAGSEKRSRPEELVGLHQDTFVMDHLEEVTCPTLAIVGSRDKAFLGATDYIERKLSNIERHTVEDAGHMIPATHGAQLGAMAAAFLAKIEGQ